VTAAAREPRVTAAMCAYGRVLAEPRLSPDGRRIAFVTNVGARGQLVVMPAIGGAEVVVTSDPPPRAVAAYGGGAFDWTPDGEALVYAGVEGGLWLTSSSGGVARRVVAKQPDGGCSAPSISPDGTRVSFVVNQQHVAVAPLDGSTWPSLLSSGADFCFDPSWSPDSARLVWHEWDVPAMPWDEGRIVVRDATGAADAVAVAGGAGISVQQPRFSPDGTRLAYLSDETGWLNLWTAAADGSDAKPLVEEAIEHGDPSWGLGQRSYAWSPEGSSIVFTRNHLGSGTIDRVDVATGDAGSLDKGVYGGLSWRGDCIAAVRSGARTPTQIVVSDEPRAQRTTVARGPVGGFEALDLPEPIAVTWEADDGATIHGRLVKPTAPSATGQDPPPLLVWVHGGPTGQTTVAWNNRLPFFLERGWAVLFPDHRGSTGHGRAYAQAVRGKWGELDTSDTAAGMREAGARGWGDRARMVPMGGSAGGFTVLNLLAHHPDLCAAGIDLYGVADLFDLNETTHRFEAHYLHSIVGPLPAAANVYRERSPIHVADRITSPLLILQGDADEVVPPAQSRAIADRLRALGRTVETHFYEGEGHGWLRPETMIDELNRIESFLRRHVLRQAP
jgi:dipeptidyl aminopeptidase/acylaminoacyl peptidase